MNPSMMHFGKRFNRFGLGGAALALVGAALAGGCQNKMETEKAALWEQNRELQARLDESRAAAQAQAQAASSAQPAPLAAGPGPVVPPIDTPPPAPFSPRVSPPRVSPPLEAAPPPSDEFVGFETHEDKAAGTLTVDILGDELFDSGRAVLKESSKHDLNKVATMLKRKYAGKTVRIEGHTDSDPIRHSKWANNMELSKARADTVRSYLVSRGVDAGLITPQGFGDTKPKTSNAAEKSQNRRVEIVVLTR